MKSLLVLILSLILLTACGERTADGVLFKTADPNLSIGFKIPSVVDAPALPTVTPVVVPEVIPEEEVGEVEPEPPIAPPCEEIKGNISSSGEKIYHVVDGSSYDRVKIDEDIGESWFCTEEEAVTAGWRKALR